MGRSFDFGLAIFFFSLGVAVRDIPTFPPWSAAFGLALGAMLILYNVFEPYLRLTDTVWLILTLMAVAGSSGITVYVQKSRKDMNYIDVSIVGIPPPGPYQLIAMNYSDRPFHNVSVGLTNQFDWFTNPIPPAQMIGDLERGLTSLNLPKVSAGVYLVDVISGESRFTETLRIYDLDGRTQVTSTVTRMSDGKVFSTGP